MKYLIIISFFCTQLLANNDSVRKNNIFIHTIPSNLLVGDISLGVEHLYKKRISQEFQAYMKCFSPVLFVFDKGFRVNYQLKYNIIHRPFFRLSINASTSYKEVSFQNKEYYWSESPEILTDLKPKYIMDKEIKSFGIGGGIGVTFKITKHFYIGNELVLEICKEKESYIIKEKQLPLSNSYTSLSKPYYYNSNTFSGFKKYNPIINFKVSYLL